MSWPLLLVINTPFSLPYFYLCYSFCWKGAPWTSYLVVLLQTLPWNSHWLWNQKKASQQLGICCDHCLSHWPILLLIIFLCSPICQSVCIHWVCLISYYSINSLKQRFLVGFAGRFPKYENNNNNSKESERRLAQHVSPTNRRFIVSVVLFITKTPLTERVCCPTADLCFLYHSVKLLWRFVWWTEFFPSSSTDCSMHFNHRFPQNDQ